MRWFVCGCIVIALGACKEDVYFIPGTGTLPECDEAPSTDLNGTLWSDQGTVTILTAGCLGAELNTTFMSCTLNWAFTQNGDDLSIVVDEEYRLEGRLCGDQLHLRGGWWLPVVDEDVGYCTYDDDSGRSASRFPYRHPPNRSAYADLRRTQERLCIAYLPSARREPL